MARVGTKLNTKTNIARAYIKSNYFKFDKRKIINELMKETGLKKRTIENLYFERQQQLNSVITDKVRNTIREQREVMRYKGRLRQFFRLDDSNLYNGLIENKK